MLLAAVGGRTEWAPSAADADVEKVMATKFSMIEDPRAYPFMPPIIDLGDGNGGK